MASLRISIFESFLSGGSVGSSFRSSVNATLNASTRIRSRVACAVRYLRVARRRRRLSSRERLENSVAPVGSCCLRGRTGPLPLPWPYAGWTPGCSMVGQMGGFFVRGFLTPTAHDDKTWAQQELEPSMTIHSGRVSNAN
uniref:Uncharacterized protein n=1 Tax=Anopheles atroparvus TaxID=41427 RepID=A0A182IL03_ANOAO